MHPRFLLPPLVAFAVVGLYARSLLSAPLGASSSESTTAHVEPGAARFLKGQLHLHSNNSGDGHATPPAVARWYAAHGYDFIVFTDHDFVTSTAGVGEMLALPGAELTQNLADCDPPSGLSCNLHVNALFADPTRKARARTTSTRRLDVYLSELEQAEALGALAQVNHPNFRYSADARVLTALADHGARLLEVANEASDSNNQGDATHPSTEALWDAVLTSGRTMYAVATDDAHDYDDAAERAARGDEVFVGDRGFVMVRARKEPGAIREALARGDFYASNGVLLSVLETHNGVLSLEVSARCAGEYVFTFVGEGGRELARTSGRSARFELGQPDGPYVRAVVTGPDGHRAWTQAVTHSATRATSTTGASTSASSSQANTEGR